MLFQGTGLANDASASYSVTANGKGRTLYAALALGSTRDPRPFNNLAIRILRIT